MIPYPTIYYCLNMDYLRYELKIDFEETQGCDFG